MIYMRELEHIMSVKLKLYAGYLMQLSLRFGNVARTVPSKENKSCCC